MDTLLATALAIIILSGFLFLLIGLPALIGKGIDNALEGKKESTKTLVKALLALTLLGLFFGD